MQTNGIRIDQVTGSARIRRLAAQERRTARCRQRRNFFDHAVSEQSDARPAASGKPEEKAGETEDHKKVEMPVAVEKAAAPTEEKKHE